MLVVFAGAIGFDVRASTIADIFARARLGAAERCSFVQTANVPVCGTAYSPTGNPLINQPYDGEVFCIETDGLASTVWRFAHNRAVWDPEYFWTQPLGNLSLDGRWFAFRSGWDGQVETTGNGDPAQTFGS